MLKWLACVVFLGVISRIFIFSAYVPSESMEPTLYAGDRLFGLRLVVSVNRGDVVVFRRVGSYLVKRVIAISGDRVVFKDKGIWLNGEELQEEYKRGITDAGTFEEGKEYIVPEGECLLLGDNREHSNDGRMFGFVKTSDIVAKMGLRYYPFERFGFIE